MTSAATVERGALSGPVRTLEIIHRARYDYSAPVMLGEHRLMYGPRQQPRSAPAASGLAIQPVAQVHWIHDAFGNSIAIAQFDGTTRMLSWHQHHPAGTFRPSARSAADRGIAGSFLAYLAEEAPDLARYVERHYPDPNATVSGWAKQFLEGEDGTDTFAMLTHMCKGIQETLKSAMRFEAGTLLAVTLESGGGTCRDYALLMMEGVRAMGLRGAVHHRIPLRSRIGRCRRRRFEPGPSACLDGGVSAGCRLGRVRSDRWHHRHGTRDPVAVARDPKATRIKGTFTGAADVAIDPLADVQARTISPAPDAGVEAAAPLAASGARVQTPITQS